jgi:hypothetical protein
MARKAFAVNDGVREKVRYLAGVGLPQDDIAKIVGCAPKTLRKRCRNDLDRGIAEANATMCGYLFAAAKAGNVVAQIFWLKTKAHWREKTAPEAPVSGDRETQRSAVLVLPDNSRDPELTEVLRDAQENYLARKSRQRSPELSPQPRPAQTENTVDTLPDGGPHPLPAMRNKWPR